MDDDAKKKPRRKPKQTKVWKRADAWYQELKDDRALRRVAGIKNPNLWTLVGGAWIAILSALVAPFALGAVSVHAFGLVVMYIGMSSVPNNGTTPACNYVMMALALNFVLEWFFEGDGKALTAEEQQAAEEQELIDEYGSLAAAKKALAKQKQKDEQGEDMSFGGNVRKQRKAERPGCQRRGRGLCDAPRQQQHRHPRGRGGGRGGRGRRQKEEKRRRAPPRGGSVDEEGAGPRPKVRPGKMGAGGVPRGWVLLMKRGPGRNKQNRRRAVSQMAAR